DRGRQRRASRRRRSHQALPMCTSWLRRTPRRVIEQVGSAGDLVAVQGTEARLRTSGRDRQVVDELPWEQRCVSATSCDLDAAVRLRERAPEVPDIAVRRAEERRECLLAGPRQGCEVGLARIQLPAGETGEPAGVPITAIERARRLQSAM